MQERTCPRCGRRWYSAAVEKDYWICGNCGARMPRPDLAESDGKSECDQGSVRRSNTATQNFPCLPHPASSSTVSLFLRSRQRFIMIADLKNSRKPEGTGCAILRLRLHPLRAHLAGPVRPPAGAVPQVPQPPVVRTQAQEGGLPALRYTQQDQVHVQEAADHTGHTD